MRRMRDISWHYFLFALPAVAGAIGVQYLIRKNYPQPAQTEMTAALKPSEMRTELAKSKTAATRTGAMKEVAKKETTRKSSTHHEFAEAETSATTHEAVTHETREPASTILKVESTAGSSHMSTGYDAGNNCTSIEYRGDGQDTKITEAEWTKTIGMFREVKDGLLVWLEKNRRQMPDRTAELMIQQMRDLKIQRPPFKEEPDLNWRGIGVWTQNSLGLPVIRVGGGFVKLVQKQPARARFEMARLAAQSWAPCELGRISAGEPWQPLLKCLDVQEDHACGAGTYSDSGWAVSSAVAAVVAPPGCTVPAFNYSSAARCLKKIPLPLSVAADETTPWKEARR